MKPFGHFTSDAREFVITDPLAPPRAQINFLWNDTIISGLNQFGSGDGVFNNQTLMYNDPRGRVRLVRDGRRYFYLRDADRGEFWNTGWCGGRRDFLGPFGAPTAPRSLVEGKMSCREAWCEELAGCLAIDVELAPNAAQQVTVLLGSFDSIDEKNRLIDKVMPADYRAAAWRQLIDGKQVMLDAVQVATPDEKINRLVNIWSKQQIQLCVEFGRDGARGFRDTLQDAWGIAPFNAPLARAKIKETLAHQHSDGHAVRG